MLVCVDSVMVHGQWGEIEQSGEQTCSFYRAFFIDTCDRPDNRAEEHVD